MTLAGMGQCALIVAARLQLAAAPAEIAVRRLIYKDVDDLLSDAATLATSGAVDTIGAELTTSPAGWSLELNVGSFLSVPDRDVPALPAGLRFRGDDRAQAKPFGDYLARRTRSVAMAAASGQPNPALILTLGAAAARSFVADVLVNPEVALGVWRIEVLPLVTSRFRRPLYPMPDDVLAFTVRLQRRASARDAPDHQAMLNVNEALVRKLVPTGAKVYPPFAPLLSPGDWRRHYGTVWPRFAAAKRRYDPRRVLTPGAAIFDQA